MICLLYAHPYPDRSRANRTLIDAVSDLPGIELRRLFDLYPDFAIDVEAEQAALQRAQVIVLQHPFYWYGVPGLLKHWFDKVLSVGWAYGSGGTALHGKTCLWVTTMGAPESGYASDGMHGHEFSSFVTPIEQTVRFCGMQWEPPITIFGSQKVSDESLAEHARTYRERLVALFERARQE